jgi:hypothetical protein
MVQFPRDDTARGRSLERPSGERFDEPSVIVPLERVEESMGKRCLNYTTSDTETRS